MLPPGAEAKRKLESAVPAYVLSQNYLIRRLSASQFVPDTLERSVRYIENWLVTCNASAGVKGPSLSYTFSPQDLAS
jgi:hypothetical protein